jgi:hypothetical protein
MADYLKNTGEDLTDNVMLRLARLEQAVGDGAAGNRLVTIDFGATSNVPTPVPGQLMYDNPSATPMMWDGTQWIPLGGSLIANTAYVWDDSGDFANPVVAFDHPVTLVAYAVDNAAGTANVHSTLLDRADLDAETPFAGWLPGPAGLGSNTEFPRAFAIGLVLYVTEDDFSTPVPSGTATVKITLSVYDPTL